MKTIIKTVFILFVFVLLFTCKEKEDVCNLNFKGIMLIDDYGNMIGDCSQNDVDWKFLDTWNSCELKFFNNISLDSIYQPTGELNTPEIEVYPIPFNDIITIHINTGSSDTSLLTVKIVDESQNLIFSLSKLTNSQILFLVDLSKYGFEYDKIYRMYYSLSFKNNINMFKGHGDIVRSKDFSLENITEFCSKFSL